MTLLLLALGAAAASPPTLPTYEVFATDPSGSGWVLHHLPGRGDSLWACPEVRTPSGCTPLRFDDWKPGTRLDLLHLGQEDEAGWLRLYAPGVGSTLYGCALPEGDPAQAHCDRVELEELPEQSRLDRIWPPLAPSARCAPNLDPTGPGCVIEPAASGDLWLQAGDARPGPVNLYACIGLHDGTPSCRLSVPNWLAVAREPVGLRRLEDLRSQDALGHAVYGPGVLVKAIAPGSVADESGLATDDIILRIDGFLVRDTRHARHLLAQVPARTPIEVELADGRTVRLVPKAVLPD